MGSPTQRSKRYLEKQGFLKDEIAVVERWNAHARVRQDLFGFIDILAVRKGETLAVQTTSYSNLSARVKKIQASPMFEKLKYNGWAVVAHGWRKKKNGRYELVERIL